MRITECLSKAEEILEILKEFGAETTINDFCNGNIIQYQKTINLANITGYIKLEKQRLITSIVYVDSKDTNDGVAVFRLFQKKSKELFKIVDVSKLKLITIAVINKDVKRFLEGRKFLPEKMLIPDELGNDGEAICYSKIIKVIL